MPKSRRTRDGLSRAGIRSSRLPAVFSENELLQILQQFKLPAIHAFRTGKDHGTGHDLFILELEGCFVGLYLFGCFRVDIVEMKIGMFCYSYQHGTLDLTD
mgnify:FL=1